MKQIKILFLLIITTLGSCIQDDFLNDEIEERISINNPIDEIQINDTYQINATFFNNVGQSEPVDFTWSSSVPSVISIDSNGLITALSIGSSVIKISVTLENGETLSEEKSVKVTTSAVDNNSGPNMRSGTIVTTSSYILEGDFTIFKIISANTTNLDLEIKSNYRASSSLPGLFIYLSNNPNSINDALEIGAVNVFRGAHSYQIPNTGINDYKYIVYWCKPFSVKVGHGEINDN